MPSKKSLLFVILGGFFISNALIAEFIGGKLFSLESTFGLAPLNFSLFGNDHLAFNMTAGVLLWPIVFVMTDIINEYFGLKGVKLLSWFAAVLIAYSFVMVWFAMGLTPATFWHYKTYADGTQLDMNLAFNAIFGQSLWIIAGSITAFLVGQLIDVKVFQALKKATGNSKLWLRATGSTLVSQFIDSFVVLFIAFYIGADFSLGWVMAICLVNYMYKFTVAILLTPLLYLVHGGIDMFLGKELATKMMEDAQAGRVTW